MFENLTELERDVAKYMEREYIEPTQTLFEVFAERLSEIGAEGWDTVIGRLEAENLIITFWYGNDEIGQEWVKWIGDL